MKARIKTTGEIVEIDSIISNAGFEFEDSSIEHMIMEVNTLWEQRRFELVKAAMQGYCANSAYVNEHFEEVVDFSRLAVSQADAVLAEYRKTH